MSVTWRKRLGLAAVVWIVVFAISAAADTDPQPFLLASLILLVATLVWLATDVTDLADRAPWDAATASSGRHRGADARIGILQRALTDVATRQDAAQLHPVLVALIDDRLAASHGIDRENDPDAAADVLGDELREFVAEPPPPLQFANHRYLDRIITEIEHL